MLRTNITFAFTITTVWLCSLHHSLAQVIVIDAGHGVQSDCTNCDRPDEEVLTNMAVALKLEDTIQAHCNWTVHLTRVSNACGQCPSLTQRETMSNSWGADRFISIHCNAGGGTGTETFWCNNSASNNADAQAFATEIQTRMVSYGQWTNRRVVEDNSYLGFHLGVLDNNNAIGCLNEIGFFDNSSDLAKLESTSWQGQFARGYYIALQNDMNITCSGGGVTPPVNDACANAIALTPNTSCVSVQGTLAGATISGLAKPVCDGFASPALKDVWYKFQATATTHAIQVASNPDFDAVISFYSSCNGGELFCADDGGLGITETINSTSLNVGTTYYIRVYDYGSADPVTPTFDICVTGQLQPALPDLDVTAVSVMPATVIVGNNVTIDYTIINTTNGTVSVNTETGYYLVPIAQGCPTAIPANNFNGGTLTVTEISDGTEDESHTVNIPASTAAGSYYLVIATDQLNDITESNENNNTFCISLTVTAIPPAGNVKLKADTVQGLPGAQVVVPVRVVSGFSNIESVQFTIEYNNTVLSYVQTQQYGLNYLDATDFGNPQTGLITLSWHDEDLDGETKANGSVLFAIAFNITGSGGSASAISFTGNYLPVEITDVNLIPATTQLSPGRVELLSLEDITGNIHTENGTSVNIVTVNATCIGAPFVTGTDGDYYFALTPGNTCTITPFKNNDVTRANGVSTFDILLIQRHLLGIQPLPTPYKIIAADVDANGSVSTLDIIRMRQLILGRTDYFPGNRLWRFVPNDFVFANPQIPFPHDTSRFYFSVSTIANEDFIAIKLGDVSDSWNPNMAKTEWNAGVAPTFTIDSFIVFQSTQVSVPVHTTYFDNIIAIQGSIEFDPTILSFDAVIDFGLPGMSLANFGTNQSSNGILTYTWDDATLSGVSLPDSSKIFVIRFNVIGTIGQFSPVNFTNNPTMLEVADVNFNTINAEYVNGKVTVDDNSQISALASTTGSIKILPNPNSGVFRVEVNMKSPSAIRITVLDMLGHKLRETESEIVVGNYRRNLDLSRAPAGIYFVRVMVGEYYFSQLIEIE